MIKEIIVTNYIGESIALSLANPWTNGLAITKIDGLGPPKATVNTADSSAMDGSVYNSAKVSNRNIVLTLKLLPVPTIEKVRQLTYKYFHIKKTVAITIISDTIECMTMGYVESNEPSIFDKDESVTVSIICPDPYLYSTGECGAHTTVFFGIEPVFEFPFSNESLTEKLLDLSEIQNKTAENVFYSGDAEIGVVINMYAIGDVKNVLISNTGTHEIMKLDTDILTTMTGKGIVAKDQITISTMKGNKFVTLLRDGVYTNILNALTMDSDWFVLAKGDNIFAFTAEEGATNLQFNIQNQVLYEGV